VDVPVPLEHSPRIGDVVDLHGELLDPVRSGERGRAPPMLNRSEQNATASLAVSRIVVVTAPELERHRR
jgi:hypothetical protein